jgi:hypothetical protein
MTGERFQGRGRDIVEVTGKTDAHGGDDAGGKATLPIHELEVYAPPVTSMTATP